MIVQSKRRYFHVIVIIAKLVSFPCFLCGLGITASDKLSRAFRTLIVVLRQIDESFYDLAHEIRSIGHDHVFKED